MPNHSARPQGELQLRQDTQGRQETVLLQWECGAGQGDGKDHPAPRGSAQERVSFSCSGWDCEEGADQDTWFLRNWALLIYIYIL